VVRQYLINKYGEKMNIPNSDLVKALVFSLLQRNTAKDDSDITLQFYTTKVELLLDLDQALRFGLHLSKTSARNINLTIEKIIHEQLHHFLEFYIGAAGYTEKSAIEAFQQIYNFPEEVYPYDTIKKHYQRHIKPYMLPHKFNGVFVPSKYRHPSSKAA
jgi:hypothetical protein